MYIYMHIYIHVYIHIYIYLLNDARTSDSGQTTRVAPPDLLASRALRSTPPAVTSCDPTVPLA